MRRIPIARGGAAATAATIAAVLSLAACGGDADGDATSRDGGLTGTITYWHAYSADSTEIETLREVVIPAFEDAHPGVEVVDVAVPYDELHQKLITAAAGSDLPDVLRSDIIWVPELASLGLLERLDEVMGDFGELADAVFPGPLETNRYGDGHYGLPLNTNTRVLMYNEQSLATAGVDGPPVTFDDVRALGAALAPHDIYAFADGGLSGWNVLPWIWSAGGDIMNDDYTRATGHLNAPESVAGVQLLHDLLADGHMPSLVLGGAGGQPTDQGLATGAYATILDGPWMYPIFANSFPEFELQVAPVPAGPGGSVSVVGGESVVVFNQTANRDLSLEFVRFLLSEQAQLAMAEIGQMSVLRDLDMVQVDDTYVPFVEQLRTARPRPPVPAWPRVDDVLQRHLQSAFSGNATVQEALDAAAAEIDDLLG